MPSEQATFSSNGHNLSGLLELPDGEIRCYALFAHCFTCGKNSLAASRISKALSRNGVAVLRFDFTGLGGSDGDFANTNFSSNLQDLIAAADYLRQEKQAPQLLVGHSLGGAAVLAIARDIPEVKAVVSIAAPRDAEHVIENFAESLKTIEAEGEACVVLGSQPFTIKRQFVDDLKRNGSRNIKALRKAVLICHSPVDEIVNIKEAEKIYKDLSHPKSFVSLDNANHLLTANADANYVASVISAWSSRYIDTKDDTQKDTQNDAQPATENAGQVVVEEKDHKFTQVVRSGKHSWLADEPIKMGGNDMGPDPYAQLLAALGSCTAMTLRLYAKRKRLPLEHVKVVLKHSKEHCEDCEDTGSDTAKMDVIKRKIFLQGDLTKKQQQRLLEIADKCPVHKTLTGKLKIKTKIGG